ncbi:MAG: class I SAM-dependent methyltransferase [Bacteroidota bacterium]
MITDPGQDPMGQAMLDYYHGHLNAEVRVFSNVAEEDIIAAKYLFRNSAGMPAWERRALDECEGRVLDIGAGAGSHALALQARGHEVVAMDISPGAVQVMKARGVHQAIHASIWDYEEGGFDTLLMLMNGIGLVGDLNGLLQFLHHARKLLVEGGQILLDSSDIAYLFAHNDKAIELLLQPQYYGIVEYQMAYEKTRSKRFKWLFIDFKKLKEIARKAAYHIELLEEGDHFQYIARLIPYKNLNT